MQFIKQFDRKETFCISENNFPEYENSIKRNPKNNFIEIKDKIGQSMDYIAIATSIINTRVTIRHYAIQNKHYCEITKTFSMYKKTIILYKFEEYNEFMRQNGSKLIHFKLDKDNNLRYNLITE